MKFTTFALLFLLPAVNAVAAPGYRILSHKPALELADKTEAFRRANLPESADWEISLDPFSGYVIEVKLPNFPGEKLAQEEAVLQAGRFIEKNAAFLGLTSSQAANLQWGKSYETTAYFPQAAVIPGMEGVADANYQFFVEIRFTPEGKLASLVNPRERRVIPAFEPLSLVPQLTDTAPSVLEKMVGIELKHMEHATGCVPAGEQHKLVSDGKIELKDIPRGQLVFRRYFPDAYHQWVGLAWRFKIVRGKSEAIFVIDATRGELLPGQ